MNKSKQLAISLALLVLSSIASAYETATHKILIQKAVERSVLFTDPSVLSDLGLSKSDSKIYRSSDGSLANTTVLELAKFGGVWEDDDYGWRSFNHFFDPQFNNFKGRGLYFLSTQWHLGNPSPDWIIEDLGGKTDFWDGRCPGRGPLQGCPQEFSFKKGQQQLFAALTGADPQSRLASASLTLQMLGHITHHIQDMGQPQHTRNDQHTHPLPLPLVDINPPWSYYELYTKKQNDNISAMLDVTQYPLPSPVNFTTARQFWHTPGAITPQFVGMAEFTAQNYTSYGSQYQGKAGDKNFIGAATDFPLPNGVNQDGTPKTIVRYSVSAATGTDGQIIPAGVADMVVGKVYDGLTKASTETILAATSILNEYAPSAKPVYVENSLIYDARHRILLPRAVAFSAGLINHFFRGRLALSQDVNGGTNQWQIFNRGSDTMDGTFYIYTEDETGKRVQLVSYRMSMQGLDRVLKTFAVPFGVKKVILVFRGKIGAEGDPDLVNGEDSFYATTGHVVTYAPPAPKITVGRTPSVTMESGKSYTVTWTTINAETVTYSCTAGGFGLVNAGELKPVNGSFTGVADASWVGHPSTCTYTAKGSGGTATYVESLNTLSAPAPVSVPEIVIVGTFFYSGNVNSKQAFIWSSKTGLTPLGVGAGGLYSQAWGISADGKTIAGSTTGVVTVEGSFQAYPWQNDPNNGLNFQSTWGYLTVGTVWRWQNFFGSKYFWGAAYLAGAYHGYSEAWKVSDNGSIIYGEGFVPNIQNPRVLPIFWTLSGPNIPTGIVYSKNGSTSLDGTIELIKVGNRAAYRKLGVTTLIPIPTNYDSSDANHVVIIK